MDENKLIAQIKNSNSLAFKQLFDGYYRSLCLYLLNYANDKDSAEELAQIVFVKFWDKRHTIDIHTSVKPYLYKMAYHQYLSSLRKKNKEASLIEQLKYEALETYETVSTEEMDFKAKRLNNAIAQLPTRCQEILKYKMQGLKYREIAETLDISIKTVESQIRTAFIKIREDFKDDLILFVVMMDG